MTSLQMLRNQVKELERQEKVRYCKNLIFNITSDAIKSHIFGLTS